MLVLEDLHKRFGEIVALQGAGFELPEGRILGFLGPNGAGKTTAMRCIFGLVRPDSGRALWKGRAITPVDRLRFGYLPEERGLYPKMKIGEQLVYFAKLAGLDARAARSAARFWLDRLGLADRATSRLEELSHGNQQRIQLAAALVHDPVLLVLDEPFAGLDPMGIESLAEVLRERAAAGVGIVFSSHQLDLVEDVCEDVVIIDHGRVVLSGNVERLKTDSERRFIEIAVDGAPWIPDVPGLERVPTADHQARFAVGSSVDLDDLLARARAAGDVTRFSFEPPTLSELFRRAVRR